jgi:large repetitive protein
MAHLGHTAYQNQPTIILEARTLNRFVDYSIDLMTHEIFLKAPLSSQDAKFNLRSLRITYESAAGGEAFFKGGVDARVKLTNTIEVGSSYARDDNPDQKMEVMGSTAIVKLGEKTTLIAEVARTDTGKNNIELTAEQKKQLLKAKQSRQALTAEQKSLLLKAEQISQHFSNQSNIPNSTQPSYINQNTTGIEGEGWAQRLEFRHEGSNLKANAQVTHADKNFNNPTSGFSQGRTEATANAKYILDAQNSLVAEAVFSKGNTVGGTRMGVTAGIEHIFNELISAQLGMRASRPGNINVQQGVGALITKPAGDLLTVHGKLTAKLPWLKGADLSAEAEQDIFDFRKHMFAVGAGYLVNDQTRLYGRYELISSLNSTYALNASQQNNRAVIGVESAYSKNGRVFSEYRIRDAVNSREAQAAMGLRHTWEVADGLRLGGSFETTHAFAGQPGSDSTAIAGSAEYTADPRYKLTGSLETRFADSGNSWLNTVGLVYKIDQDWSLLARHGLSIQENSSDGSELWRTRQQIGVAWRQVNNNRWNALGRYEHRLDEQSGGKLPYNEHSHILSTHVNYQPREDLIATGRYALKWSEQNRTSTLAAKALTHLIYGRVTWDFWKDFDASLQSSALIDEYALQFSEGIEVGYQVVNDLWASVGYNMQGFDGGDLKGTDYTAQGFYVRARFKFDEALFN